MTTYEAVTCRSAKRSAGSLPRQAHSQTSKVEPRVLFKLPSRASGHIFQMFGAYTCEGIGFRISAISPVGAFLAWAA